MNHPPGWFTGEGGYGSLDGEGAYDRFILPFGLLSPPVGNGALSTAKLRQNRIGRDVDSSSGYGEGQK